MQVAGNLIGCNTIISLQLPFQQLVLSQRPNLLTLACPFPIIHLNVLVVHVHGLAYRLRIVFWNIVSSDFSFRIVDQMHDVSPIIIDVVIDIGSKQPLFFQVSNHHQLHFFGCIDTLVTGLLVVVEDEVRRVGMQQEMRFCVLEAWEVVSVHYFFYLIDPLCLIQGEIKLVFGLIVALLQLKEDEETCKVINYVVVGLVFLEMNSLHVPVLWSSEFRFHIQIFPALLVFLNFRLLFVTLCNGLLFALFLSLFFSFWPLFEVFRFLIFMPVDGQIWHNYEIEVFAVHLKGWFSIGVKLKNRLVSKHNLNVQVYINISIKGLKFLDLLQSTSIQQQSEIKQSRYF